MVPIHDQNVVIRISVELDTNTRFDVSGDTALQTAVKAKHEQLIRMLLNEGIEHGVYVEFNRFTFCFPY